MPASPEALAETRVLGVTTNRGFLAWLLRLPEVIEGTSRTDTIETRWHPDAGLPESAWAEAASALGDARMADETSAQLTVPSGFRLNGPRQLAVELDGERRVMPVGAADHLRDTVADSEPPDPPTRATATSPERRRHRHRRRWPRLACSAGAAADHRGRLARRPPRIERRRGHHGAHAGVVSGVRVREGEVVEAHQVLLVLEAMKMENAITAPVDGLVEHLLVKTGQVVKRGDILVELAD